MDILSGISSPFELNGERQGLKFAGGDQDGQFEVRLGSGSHSTQVNGSWDYSATSGSSNFYYDLTVVDNDEESDLMLWLSRNDQGEGTIHISNPGSREPIEVTAPLGDLSNANSSVFESSYLSYACVRDVAVETYDDGISVSIYRDGQDQAPVRYLVHAGQVCIEE